MKNSMKKQDTAFIFPGQGSQAVGMGRDIFEEFTEAKNVFAEVSDAIRLNIAKLIFESNEEELKKTENTQVALFTTSIAFLKVLEKEIGKKCEDLVQVVAGHSLGEYSALCASGSISISQGAYLLRKRGEFMASAFPTGGAMLAVIGLLEAEVEEVINLAKEDKSLVIANDNCDGQIVLSGNIEAIERASKLSKEKKAKMCIKLDVSGPFHSPLLKDAESKMQEELLKAEISLPKISVINNVDVNYYTSVEEIRSLLAKQITSKVRWRETMLKMEVDGIKNVIEIGSGKVLTGLFKRTTKSINLYNVFNVLSLKEFISILNK